MQNRFSTVLLLLSGAVALSILPALAQGRGQGQGQQGRGRDHAEEQSHGHQRKNRKTDRDRLRFGNRDRGIIAAYYREHRRDLPPGLAKREHLPPGLERQLERNGRLPPGLQKRAVWFPSKLDRRLGPLPTGYGRCWVGSNVLIVNRKTFAILDIIRDVTILAH